MNIPSFIAVDLETTGLEFEKDEIIEVALVRFENGKMKDSMDCLVKPQSITLRPFIEKLTGIKQEELDASEDFASLAGKFYSFIGDLPLVAHNASFDFRFLSHAFEKVGISFSDRVVWDSLTLSRIAYQDVANHRLDTLVKALGIERTCAHRALPDAEACGNLFVMSYEKIMNMDPWFMQAMVSVSKDTCWQKLFETEQNENDISIPYILPEITNEINAIPKEKSNRVSEFFKKEGLLSANILGYTYRANQEDFASVVDRNMYKGGLCVLEAPTGSGKTLAYLVAGANKAVSGERVVISTATRTLQQQIWNHDIPKIAPLFNGKLKAAILKGRDNYLCLRKFEEILKAPHTLLLPEEKDSFMALIPWVIKTTTGDINECTSFNHGRNRVLWSKMSSNASSCEGEKCAHFARCPGLCAKRKAMESNLLLVNHSLFMADLNLEFALLPTYEHIIFDEAHRLPEISNQAMSRVVSFFSYRNIAKTLVPSKNKRDGLLVEIQNGISQEDSVLIESCEQLINELNETEKCIHRFFMKIGKRIGKQKGDKGNLVYYNGILADYDADPKTVIDQFSNVKKIANELFDKLSSNKVLQGLLNNARGRIEELSRFITDFEFLVKAGRKEWVFYLEEPFNPHTLKMHGIPLQSGKTWSEKFYPWIKSALFTSATLAVQGDLNYFVHKMGMDNASNRKRPFLKVYNDNKLQKDSTSVMVAKYMPKPSTQEYGDALNSTLIEILPKVKENTLVLFTSIATMMKAQKMLAPAFAEANKLLLCQHVDGAIDGLVSMFRQARGACLLGCQSLWEGVDLPGDALKLLVITKLPFPNPSDPLVAGISADMKERGENTFKNYYVPEAYMELRQGLGRLIRSEEDSGKILILDNRVVNEAYGKTFTRIWGMNQKIASSIEELKDFV